MARTKKTTEEVVEQTTEEVVEQTTEVTTESINVDNPVDLEQAAEPTEQAEPELTNPEEGQAEPDKVSEVMDCELVETEQEKQEEEAEKQEEKGEENEEKPEQNELEQEEHEEEEKQESVTSDVGKAEPKISYVGGVATQVINNPITGNRPTYAPQKTMGNYDKGYTPKIETGAKGVRVNRNLDD